MDLLITFLSLFIPLYCVYQLGSLAGIFSERSGVANIAIEGNMIIGAVTFALLFQNLNLLADGTTMSEFGTLKSFIIAILIALPLSATFMMLLGILVNRYQADHIIAGTALNILAPLLMIMLYLIFSPHSGGTLRPDKIDIGVDGLNDFIWHLYPGGFENSEMNKMYIVFLIITVLIVIVSAFFLNKTRFGLRLKTSGENPYALETAGISVNRTRYKALFISGLLASLAGMVFLTKDTFFFTVNGSGFLAIGILILGQYRVLGTVFGSLILAAFISFFEILPLYLGTGSDSIDQLTNVFKMIPFLIPLLGLAFFKTSYSPKAVGKNFKKDQR